jgi:peroxiredoxin
VQKRRGYPAGKKNRRLIGFAAGVICAVSLLSSCHQMVPLAPDSDEYAPTLAPPVAERLPGVGTSVGSLAPDFMLNDLNGNTVKLSDYRGKMVMLNFWTYCDACKEEMPYIQSIVNVPGGLPANTVVLAVNVTQDPGQVQQFVSYYGLTFNIVLDRWGTIASEYYIHQIPTTLFIDKNGVIQDIQSGKFSSPDAIKKKLVFLASR